MAHVRGNIALALIIKSENSLIPKTNIPHALQNWQILYYGQEIDYKHWAALFHELKTNFDLNKLENLSIQSDRQSIISIQLFFNVMGWKRPSNHFQNSKCFMYVKIWFFCLIHKVDLCLANLNLRVPKWFAMYPVNIISHNKYAQYYTNV